ncbi:MAG: hypothetical protein HUJ98_07710, partial [Bacteroidaceae bacterium]|nr:hypothetical protein [Bacteroidaceae bacterium]
QYDASGKWLGSLQEVAVGQMYKVQMANPAALSLIGKLVDPAQTPITIAKGSNWIGLNTNYYLSPNEAFAGLEPENGDMVKSQSAFAIYMDYEWVGNLNALTPGNGYLYKSKADATKTFTYPKSNAPRSKAPMKADDEQEHKYESCSINKYEGNMNIIAQVWKDGKTVECEIAVFDSNGECRGSELSMYDNNLVFLTIQGEGEGEPLSIRVVYSEGGNVYDVLLGERIYYVNDALIGELDKPMIIDLGGYTGIGTISADDDNTEYYNIGGIRVDKKYEGLKISKGSKTFTK